ncbi:hypothetical protein [Microbacterium sp. 1.5R]|uniref:hypothetical protein n=1 Tax=Microbacterium sp. 1.5R TaxID=1916917 RepID=UPI0016428573|nr:hypothetical protein [Microbacterium sp. 1.5R]
MDFGSNLSLLLILNLTLAVLGIVVGRLLLYLVIKQAVFHGLRAHTRWIDAGKD